MTSSAPLPIETLLQHRSWMHSLARRLVQDDGAADDVMQEAWLASLRSPPRRLESVRGWLSKVVRSKAADTHRTRRAQPDHDLVRTVADRTPSVEESLAEAELRRRVSELVLGLDARYRDVLVLRFFEGLPPREAARRLGCPVETVRTRTRRALDRLRTELDTQHDGGRRQWVAALVPLARLDRGTATSAGSAAAITGAVVMSANTKIGVAAAVALVLGLASGWLAGTAAGEDGEAGERALVVANDERDAERERAEELATELTTRDDRVRALQGELRDANTRIAELDSEASELRASLESALAAGAPADDGAPLTFAAYDDVLDAIDWDTVGKSTGELVQLLTRLRAAIDAGEELAPEEISGLQNKNAPLIAAAASVAGKLPGSGMNGPYASPPFMSNLISATLRAGGAPLTEEQLRALDRLAQEQLRRDEERTAGYDATTPELRRLYDEVVARTRFFDDATAMLTTEQTEMLRPASVRDVANLDLFSPAIQWGQFVRQAIHNGTRSSVAQVMSSDFRRMAQPGEEHDEELQRVIREWADGLPDELLEPERDELAKLMMYDGAHVTRSAEAVLRLYDTILRTVPLAPETQQRVREIPAPLVLLRR